MVILLIHNISNFSGFSFESTPDGTQPHAEIRPQYTLIFIVNDFATYGISGYCKRVLNDLLGA